MAAAPSKDSKESNVTPISEARPRSKKLLLVLAGGVLLCAGGGGAAWWMMQSQPHAPQAAKPQPPAPPVFLELETFTVNLAGDRILQTTISLQVKESGDADQLKLYLPQVKSRLLLLLSAKTVDELQTAGGKEGLAGEIAAALRQPYEKNLPPPTISGVFLTSFVIQ